MLHRRLLARSSGLPKRRRTNRASLRAFSGPSVCPPAVYRYAATRRGHDPSIDPWRTSLSGSQEAEAERRDILGITDCRRLGMLVGASLLGASGVFVASGAALAATPLLSGPPPALGLLTTGSGA